MFTDTENKDIKNEGFCTGCGRHCPLSALSCDRGRALAGLGSADGKSAEGNHGGHEHSDHDHGEHDHGGHDHGEHDHGGEGRGCCGHGHGGRGEGRGCGRGQERGGECGRGESGEGGEGCGHGRGGRGEGRGCGRGEAPETLEDKLDICAHMARRGGCGRHRGQRGILKLLAREGSMGQREIQELLGIQAGSMSEIAAKLERKGLIDRVSDESDGRKVSLVLTDEGKALSEMPEEEGMERDIFACLTGDERAALEALLDKLLAFGKQAGDNGRG